MGGISLTRLKHGRGGNVTCCESTPSFGQGRGARLHRAGYSKGARGMWGRVVRKLFVAGVAVAGLFAAPAMAGDLPINAPVYAPLYRAPPIIALSWTGCYLGGHIGGSFVDKKFGGPFVDNAVPSTFGAPTSFAISDPSVDLNSTGLLGGGQVGCNFQFAANWVIGFEADASGANQQGGGASSLITEGAVLNGTVVSSNGTASSRTDFIATATGRLGYTFGRLGEGMVYAKGGGRLGQGQVPIQRPSLDQPFVRHAI